jgi:hypothetical protein
MGDRIPEEVHPAGAATIHHSTSAKSSLSRVAWASVIHGRMLACAARQHAATIRAALPSEACGRHWAGPTGPASYAKSPAGVPRGG